MPRSTKLLYPLAALILLTSASLLISCDKNDDATSTTSSAPSASTESSFLASTPQEFFQSWKAAWERKDVKALFTAHSQLRREAMLENTKALQTRLKADSPAAQKLKADLKLEQDPTTIPPEDLLLALLTFDIDRRGVADLQLLQVREQGDRVFLVKQWVELGGVRRSDETPLIKEGGQWRAEESRELRIEPKAADVPKLPEFHGFYVLDQGKYSLLKKSGAVEAFSFTPDINFLYYGKEVATGLVSGDFALQPLYKIRMKIEGVSIDANLGDFALANPKITHPNEWKPGGKLIDCRTKSVPGQPEMLQIVPSEPLSAGAYAVRGLGFQFGVFLEKAPQYDECDDKFYPETIINAKVEDGKRLARQAIEKKDWKTAFLLTWGGGRLAPRDTEMNSLSIEARFGTDMSAAAFHEAAEEWGSALKAYKTALALKPEDSGATAALGRARAKASTDPSAFEEVLKLAATKDDRFVPLSLAFAADSKQVVAVGDALIWDRSAGISAFAIIAWDSQTGKELTKTKDTASYIMTSLNSDGTVLAIGAFYGARVLLWDVSKQKVSRTLTCQGSVRAVALNAKGNVLATASEEDRSRNPQIQFWSVESGKPTRTIRLNDLAPHALCFSQDGKLLAASSYSKPVVLWNATSGEALHTIAELGDVRCLAFNPDNSCLAVGTDEASVILLEVATSKKLRTLTGHSKTWRGGNHQGVLSLTFTSDGRRLVSTGADATVRVWNPVNGNCLATLKGHQDAVNCATFSHDGSRLATGSADGSVRIWTLKE